MTDRVGRRLVRASVAYWTEKLWLRVVVQVAAAILVGLVGFLPAILAVIVGLLGLALHAPAIALREATTTVTGQLEDEHDRLQERLHRARDAADVARTQWLSTMLRRHALEDNERVTLYAYAGEGRLAKVARWAKNQDWQTEGRPIYPNDLGLIGKAWAEGHVYEPDIPDPATNKGEYVRFHVDSGLEPQAVETLDMPTRSYAGFRLEDGDHYTGIVMFESTEPDGLRPLQQGLEAMAWELQALGVVAASEMPSQPLGEEDLLGELE
jgi:hypothetical protein